MNFVYIVYNDYGYGHRSLPVAVFDSLELAEKRKAKLGIDAEIIRLEVNNAGEES